ncbi:unnamed protein product [Clonostachys rhizophaga]|uniref:Uncharacterized protein n=1 Tax=Clonostachys rhizophaga TaxID=160324 RepID=A0A9N9V6T8_9HYPO|nr:unnamed protein product [Clonostachys rhizophaga]
MEKPIIMLAQIEIKASPTAVRSVVTLNRPNEINFSLSIGDHLRVNIYGVTFRPYILEASLPGLCRKRHFHFSPSKVNPGTTTFVQEEHFTGAMTHIFGAWTKKNPQIVFWHIFNLALEREVETSTTQLAELRDTSKDSQTFYTSTFSSELDDTSV